MRSADRNLRTVKGRGRLLGQTMKVRLGSCDLEARSRRFGMDSDSLARFCRSRGDRFPSAGELVAADTPWAAGGPSTTRR